MMLKTKKKRAIFAAVGVVGFVVTMFLILNPIGLLYLSAAFLFAFIMAMGVWTVFEFIEDGW